MAKVSFVFVLLCNFGLHGTEGFLGEFARTVATNALAGGLAAATGAQPLQQMPSAPAAAAAPAATQQPAAGNRKQLTYG